MFEYFINVPMNENGLEEFENCAEEMHNVYSEELTDEEYEVLSSVKGVFKEFYRSFGAIIDVCEDEDIENEDIEKAIEITESYIVKAKTEAEKSGLQKVLNALLKGREAGYYVEFNFFLSGKRPE